MGTVFIGGILMLALLPLKARASVCEVSTAEQMFQCMQNYISEWSSPKTEDLDTMNFRNPHPDWIVKTVGEGTDTDRSQVQNLRLRTSSDQRSKFQKVKADSAASESQTVIE